MSNWNSVEGVVGVVASRSSDQQSGGGGVSSLAPLDQSFAPRLVTTIGTLAQPK
jgi:hypothetical protein